MRRDLKYFEMRDFRGGINQEPESALRNQLLDARNVWCPNGFLERRPGTRGAGSQFTNYIGTDITPPNYLISYVAATGTYTTRATWLTIDISNFTVGDMLYCAVNDWTALTTRSNCIYMTHDAAGDYNSTAGVYFQLEYWNGTRWVGIDAVEVVTRVVQGLPATNEIYKIDTMFGVNTSLSALRYHTFYYATPNDMAITTINARTSRFFRFRVIEGTMDASVVVGRNSDGIGISRSEYRDSPIILGSKQVQFISGSRYVYVSGDAFYDQTNSRKPYIEIGSFKSTNVDNGVRGTFNPDSGFGVVAPATFALVSDTDECFIGVGNNVYLTKSVVSYDSYSVLSGIELAPVENDALVVGPGSIYDPSWIAQLAVFPKANYVLYFKGHLWLSGISDEPYTVRWSAPFPNVRVLPSISYEPIGEEDSSPITALSSFQEHMVVFKRDSIWRMVLVGTDPETGLNSFTPIKDVSGVGCINHATIERTPDGLIFLAEDGVYLYNGTPTVYKLSGAIDQIISKVSPSASYRACSVHWRTASCYMLSVPYDQSDKNTLVLVYDYKNKSTGEDGNAVGSWWVWDSWNAQSWMKAEGEDDKETIYFVDEWFRVMQLGSFQNDYGSPIESYIETHRIGDDDKAHFRAREIKVISTNKADDVSVQISSDDAEFDSNYYTLSMDDPHGNEVALSDFVFGEDDQFVEEKRREARIMTRKDGNWFKLKIMSDDKNQKFKLYGVAVGVIPLGDR